MRKTFNFILSGTISAFLTFAWCRYLLHDNVIAGLSACIVGFCLGYVSTYISDKKTEKERKSQVNKQTIAALKQTLAFVTDNSCLLAEMLGYFNYKLLSEVAKNDDFFVTHDNQKILVTNNFYVDKLTADFVLKAVNKAKASKQTDVIMFCNAPSNEAVECCQTAKEYEVNVKIVDINTLANLLTVSNKMPRNMKQAHKRKKTDIVASYALCNKRSVHYLSAAIFFVAISFVSYIKLYNLVWATILFALGMYSLLNKRYNDTRTSTVL